MNAMAAIAPRTPIFANIIAPDMEACAAPARNRTALKSIHTTMDGFLKRENKLMIRPANVPSISSEESRSPADR
jgi:hypothetical protein